MADDMDMEAKLREMATNQGMDYDSMSEDDRRDLMHKMQSQE